MSAHFRIQYGRKFCWRGPLVKERLQSGPSGAVFGNDFATAGSCDIVARDHVRQEVIELVNGKVEVRADMTGSADLVEDLQC